MSEMVERLTEVIFLMLPTSCTREMAKGIAENVLISMREPTEGMIDAGMKHIDVDNRICDWEAQWRAMIDAALK